LQDITSESIWDLYKVSIYKSSSTDLSGDFDELNVKIYVELKTKSIDTPIGNSLSGDSSVEESKFESLSKKMEL
jgi:hypothetical protein